MMVNWIEMLVVCVSVSVSGVLEQTEKLPSQLLIEFLEAQVGSMRSSSVSYDSNLLGAAIL